MNLRTILAAVIGFGAVLFLAVAGCYARDRFEERLIVAVNAYRVMEGIEPLQQDDRLSDAGALWIYYCHGILAHDLPVEDCWGRTDPPDIDADGVCAIWERQFVCGWTASGSEAGASSANDPEWIVYAWMNSPPHRAGLLDPWWTHAGVGKGNGLTYLEVGGP